MFFLKGSSELRIVWDWTSCGPDTMCLVASSSARPRDTWQSYMVQYRVEWIKCVKHTHTLKRAILMRVLNRFKILIFTMKKNKIKTSLTGFIIFYTSAITKLLYSNCNFVWSSVFNFDLKKKKSSVSNFKAAVVEIITKTF